MDHDMSNVRLPPHFQSVEETVEKIQLTTNLRTVNIA